jgi:flagellar biosynthesis protein FlhG
MLDQATRLREMAAAYRAQATGAKPRRMNAIAVTSGKGGVGKTNFSINLAHALLAGGKDVLLMDVDLGMANADILLGTVPPYHLGHFLRGEKDILQIIHQTQHRLKLIAGGSGFVELGNLSADKLQPVVRNLKRLEDEADYLILDTGAGLGDSVLEFALAADQVVVVTTPEPTALADAYTMIKAMYYRNPKVETKLVVNQVERLEEGAAVAERICTTARDFLGLQVEHVGTIPRDPAVWQAVRLKTPFFIGFPNAPASRAVAATASRLMNGAAIESQPKSAISSFFDRLGSLFGRRNSSAV